jgi:hypothetical protein
MKTRTVRIAGKVWRSSTVRAVSALAVAGALFGALPNPAATGDEPIAADAVTAPSPSIPLGMVMSKLHCADEQGDGLVDLHSEPYLVMFVADISGVVPRTITVRSKRFGNVDSGETHFHPNPLPRVWDFNSDATGSPILDPNKLIFLGALLEADPDSEDTNGNRVRARVASELFPKLLAYKNAGLSRRDIVRNLKADMDVAIDASRSSDDQIGGIKELRLTLADVVRARANSTVIKTLSHVEHGANYTTFFVLQRFPFPLI